MDDALDIDAVVQRVLCGCPLRVEMHKPSSKVQNASTQSYKYFENRV